jgi:hypothetical protein
MDAVADVSTKSAELIGNMNELALSMVKSSTEHAERTAGQNKTMIRIGVIAIVVSVVVSIAISIVTTLQERERDASLTVMLKQVTGQLETSQSAFAAAQRDAAMALQKELEAQRSALQVQIRAMEDERKLREKQARSGKR